MLSKMAASLVRCRLCFSKVLHQNNRRYAATAAYYVLLPEVPPDTPQTNPIMRTNENPKFADLTPDKAITGCAKLAIQYDVDLGKHIEQLKDGNFPKDFDSVFNPVEKLTVPLNYAWRTAKNLSYVKGSDGYRQSFQRIHPQVERSKNERWISEPLHHAVKEVKADKSNLTKYQERLVDMYLLEGRLNGIEIYAENRKKFIEILGKLVDVKNHFRNRVMLSHNLFSHNIENFEQVLELPKALVAQLAVDKNNPSRGPWRLTLNKDTYQPFMEHCSHRLMRWNLWNAYNNRASIIHDTQNLSNHNLIKDIRTHRKDIAQLLGYENFAEMSMETKMAGSVQNVLNMIESLKTKFEPLLTSNIAKLQDFANSEGFHAELEMWDIQYWRRRHRESQHKVDQEALRHYFPYPKVLTGILSLCNTLFGVEFVDCTSEVDTWHKDVSYYRVLDPASGAEVGGFYIDPYSRPPQKMMGAWVEAGRERSDIVGTTPISYMNLNISPPFRDSPALLTPEEASTIFYEFGHTLQQILTTVPYSEISGQRNVEWDTLQTCGLVMMKLFYQVPVMKSVSGHWETGESLPESAAESIIDMKKHMTSIDLMHQLYLSAFDMEMYISDEFWVNVMKNVWPQFIPLPLHQDDSHPCSLTQIFSDQYPAAYYSFIWADMIAADIVKSFTDAGLENKEKLSAVGMRFKDTYLSQGGGIPAGELFRRFRGRDPSIDPFVVHHGGSV